MFSEFAAFVKDAMSVHPVMVNVCILAVAVLGGILAMQTGEARSPFWLCGGFILIAMLFFGFYSLRAFRKPGQSGQVPD